MNKIEGVPFHGTLPTQKYVHSTGGFSKAALGQVAGMAAYGLVGHYAGNAALGARQRLGPRAAVHAGRALAYRNLGTVARVARRGMGA